MSVINCTLRGLALTVAVTAVLLTTQETTAGTPLPVPTLQPPFSEHYSLTDIGSVPGLPEPYAGLTFVPGEPDTLLIGGLGNVPGGGLYTVTVTRDSIGHISGFTGTAERAADAPFIDGGLVHHGGVLFYARYQGSNPVEIGQIKPGSTTPDKVVDLAALGVAQSPGGLNVVPPGYPGAGQMKMASYSDGQWYTLALAPDGAGTYDVTSATMGQDLIDGLENFVFVPPGSPHFGTNPSVLIDEFNDGSLSAYELDVNGDPIPGSRQAFLDDVPGPVGAVFDPLTGDLLISDYESPKIYVVKGFPAYTSGDIDCDNDVDASDALPLFLHEVGIEVERPDWCPAIGSHARVSAAPAGNGAPVFGDVDCNFVVNINDGIVILRYVADLPLGISEFCPGPNTPVFVDR